MEGHDKILLHVSKAVAFEPRKKLPKFEHANMAVINPIHKEKKELSPFKPGKMKCSGTSVRPEKKIYTPKLLPDHLVRCPVETLLETVPSRRQLSVEETVLARAK